MRTTWDTPRDIWLGFLKGSNVMRKGVGEIHCLMSYVTLHWILDGEKISSHKARLGGKRGNVSVDIVLGDLPKEC